jgi:hypothetical protein
MLQLVTINLWQKIRWRMELQVADVVPTHSGEDEDYHQHPTSGVEEQPLYLCVNEKNSNF